MKKNISKRLPQRTCVACRQVREKKQLVRLVRNADGSVQVSSGREDGRGAYICRQASCWQEGLKGDRLERALKTKLSQDTRERLREYGSEIGQE
ncbi:MAG: YlxR family protein [Dehalococcoidales bacterium]